MQMNKMSKPSYGYPMFGLSTELITTKDKLVTVKRLEGLRSKHQHSNLFTVANFPLVINSVNKPNIVSTSH